MYIGTCSVQYEDFQIKEKHAFAFDSPFKPFHQTKFCGFLIGNTADEPIFVLDDNDR